MIDPIKFSYNGTDYTLYFTRATCRQLGEQGFDLTLLDSRPLEMVPMLFHGAFMAEHPKVRRKFTDDLLYKITNRKELIGALAELYAEPIRAIVEEPDDEEGNVVWTRG